jgi:intron-binding protein aquarius
LPPPPYKLTFKHANAQSGDDIMVQAYHPPRLGPYPDDVPAKNAIRFTPAQIDAIHSGINPGLTLIVGPPGSGKTDTAVQIISNLYHNYPNQKIVLVTHSNAALNDLFIKIMDRDIDPRHLLRLGSGERELRDSLGSQSGEHFDKQGRVNWCLERRLHLLGQVQHLSQSIRCLGDHGASCETAEYFFNYEIKPRITKFEDTVKLSTSILIADVFPFQEYFSDVPEALFTGKLTDCQW